MKYILTILVSFAIMMTPVAETNAQKVTDYETAVGLRLGWGFTLSGKHFINDAHAVEGILSYQWGWTFYNRTRIGAVYQVHYPLEDLIDGLSWYWGVGGLVAFESFSSLNISTQTYFGIIGNIGLDYSVEGMPLNISLDIMPNWLFGSRSDGFGTRRGFRGDLGGLAVRYILQ